MTTRKVKYDGPQHLDDEIAKLTDIRRDITEKRKEKFLRTGDPKYDITTNREKALTKELNRLRSARRYYTLKRQSNKNGLKKRKKSMD